jgi:hypothetical protein
MAQLAEKAIRMGLDLSMTDIARAVKQDYLTEQASSLSELSGNQLLQALGPELLKKVREADLARRQPVVRAAVPPPASARPRPSDGRANPHLMTRAEAVLAGILSEDEV